MMSRDAVTGLHTVDRLRRLSPVAGDDRGLPNPTSVLVIDVENLAAINRDHGREAGDQVLASVVRLARACLRSADLLFRHGSDEFVALLMQTDKRTADELAERLVASSPSSANGPAPAFRLSAVTATAPADGTSLEQLIATAVRMLHRPLGDPDDSQGPRESIH
jgi:diguanylate cyclase (GGDEF)-like protein